jgi:TonB family protein
MSNSIETWKAWEGKVVDGKFPLREWLGGTDHSAVFVTESREAGSQKATIKLVPSTQGGNDAQLSRWAEAARLSHPHLIQIFSYGRAEIDGTRFLYVVMEHADEHLAEVIPIRPLSADESLETLRPASEGLASLHQSGWVHGHIKPSNVLAVNNQLKLSADGLRRANERGNPRALDGYDAPEAAGGTLTPASDIWSLGMTLLAVLTQKEPRAQSSVHVPEGIAQPLLGIIQRCVLIDPDKRSSAKEIQRQLSPEAGRGEPRVLERTIAKKLATEDSAPARSKPWTLIAVVVVVLLLAGWLITKFAGHGSPAAISAGQPESSQPSAPAAASPHPSMSDVPFSQGAAARGSVLQRVMPDVSKGALRTITGRIKVGVEVAVDSSGNVSNAKLSPAGPSRYFSSRALEAGRQWKFKPPQANGQAVASNWRLLFEFGRGSTQVIPTELRP